MKGSSEALFKVEGARLDFRSYVVLLSWAGVYIGAVVGLASILFNMFSAPVPIEAGALTAQEVGPIIIIIAPILGGINMLVSAIFSYPLYRFATNRIIKQNLSGWRAYESIDENLE